MVEETLLHPLIERQGEPLLLAAPPDRVQLWKGLDETPPSHQRNQQPLAIRRLVGPSDVVSTKEPLSVPTTIDLLGQRIGPLVRAELDPGLRHKRRGDDVVSDSPDRPRHTTRPTPAPCLGFCPTLAGQQQRCGEQTDAYRHGASRAKV